MAAPQQRSRRDPVGGGIVDRRGQRGAPQSALAVQAHGEPKLLGDLRVDPGRRPRDGLRPGPAQQRLRARPDDGNVALGTALPRAERRAQRPGRGGATGSTAPRTRRPSDSMPRRGGSCGGGTLTSRERAVHRHRPDRVERTRPPEHHRVSAVRQRCDLRARRREGAVRWKFVTIKHPWRYPLEAGGGGAVVSRLRRPRGTALRGQLEPGALGRDAGAAERRRVSGPGPVHGLAARPRRPRRPAALVRPGDAARHSGLRLPGDAHRRDARRHRPRARSRKGGAGDRLGPSRRGAGAGPPSSGCTGTTSARFRGAR